MKRNRDGTYFIRYSDGDEEPAVDASHIRRVAGTVSKRTITSSSTAAASDSEAAATVFKLGAAVEARYSGRSQWLRGTVTGVHRDSSYDIRYTDSGELEQRVPARLVRAAAAAAAAVQESEVESDAPHKLGAAVEARRSSTGKRSRCTVVAVHRDGSYDVRFADGDVEDRIAARLVTAATATARAPSEAESEGHKVGAVVEARRAGGRTFSRATVTAVHRDGSYDVRFVDGDTEQRMQPRLLRALSSKGHDSGGSDSETAAASAAVKLLRVGAEVEARYKGRSAYLRGAVTAVHRDGSFDIRYATGEHEDRVAAQLVRPLHKRSSANSSDGGGGSTRSATSDSEDERSRSDAPLTVGEAVTGRYKGGSKSSAAPATVTAVHRDGTCDLRYASGKSETRVERRYVALTSSRCSGASRSPQRDATSGSSSSGSVYKALLARVHDAVVARQSAGGLSGLREALKSKASRDSFGRRALLTGADWRVTLESHLRLRISDSEQSAVLQRCSDKKGRIKLADFVTAVEQAAAHSNDSDRHSSDSETEQHQQQQRSRRGSDASASGVSGASSDEQDSAGKSSSSGVKAAGAVLPRALRKQLQALCAETLRSGAAVAAFTACSSISNSSSSGSSGSSATVKEAQLGRLLRKLQLEASAAERTALWSCLDTDEDGRVTLGDLLELLLCATSEDAARDTAAAHKRILAALQAAKGSAETAGQRLSAALRKADPKGSGFVSAKDLRRCLEKADAKGASSDDAATVARRLDPAARGHIHSASLLTWLCSGLDTAKVCAKAGRLLQLAESGGSPLELALQALNRKGTHAVSAKAFRAVLRQLGPALTHAQTCALTAEFAAGDDDDDDVDYRRFLALSDAPRSNGKSGNRSRSSSPSKQRRAAAGGSGSESGSSAERGDKRASKSAADSGSSDSEGSEQLALVSRHTRAALCALAERPGDALRKAFAAAAGTGSEQQQQELVLTKPGQLRKLLRKLDLGLADDTALNSLAECLDVDGDGRVTYGEFLEFTLGSADSAELSSLHTRLSTDLAAKTAERNGKSNGGSKSNSSSKLSAGQVAARAFQKYDPGASGRLSAADFKRGLERLGCGELQQEDRALLLARFDPSESGEVQYEQFCAWAGSGCDSERAVAKVGRCLGLLKARGSSLKRVFAAMDTDGSGKLSARELHKALHKVSSSSSSCSSSCGAWYQ
jgi:Ca2+-binding EF-hand superfamily protein